MKRYTFSISVILLSCLVVYCVVLAHVPKQLRVSFLDVGQGDAIFIQSPSGIQVLVDGGVNARVIESLNEVMPLFDKSIDLVIATHPDADHVGGLVDVFEKFTIHSFLESGGKSENGVQEILNKKVIEEKVNHIIARRGQVFDLGEGVMLTILFPYTDVSNLESNAGSIVLQITYGEQSFLLTGDAPTETELFLVGADEESLRSSVLKLGHHGSRTSTSPLFMNYVKPHYSVVSSGKENRYGHPDKNVLEIVQRFQSKVLRTDELGTITFSTNGKEIEVLNLPEDFQEEIPE